LNDASVNQYRDIEELSNYPAEKEVLLNNNSILEIVSIKNYMSYNIVECNLISQLDKKIKYRELYYNNLKANHLEITNLFNNFYIIRHDIFYEEAYLDKIFDNYFEAEKYFTTIPNNHSCAIFTIYDGNYELVKFYGLWKEKIVNMFFKYILKKFYNILNSKT